MEGLKVKQEYTPGPWNTSINGDSGQIGIYGPLGESIATCYARQQKASHIKLPQEANAVLIATAPELLEACKGALEAIKITEPFRSNVFPKETRLLEQAIAKAEGRA